MKKENKILIIIIFIFLLLICCLICVPFSLFILRSTDKDSINTDITTQKENEAYYFKFKNMNNKAVDLYYKAEELDSENNYAKAYETINKALEIDPMQPGLMDLKCYILIHLNELEKALDVCSQVYEMHPNSPFTLSKLAQIHYLNDECILATKYCKELANLEGIMEVDKRKMYGNAGFFLAECESEPKLAEMLLKEAIKRTIDKDLKQIYQEKLAKVQN